MVPASVSPAPVFLEQACEFEWMRGELFRITDPGSGASWIMEADVFADSIASMATCYREYRQGRKALILKFPKPEVIAKS